MPTRPATAAAAATQVTTLAERIAAGQTTRFGTPLCDTDALCAAERKHGYNLGVAAFYAGLPSDVHKDPAMSAVPAGYPYCNENMGSYLVAFWRRGYQAAQLGQAPTPTHVEPTYPSSTLKRWLAGSTSTASR